MHSEGKTEQICKDKRKCTLSSLRAAHWRVPLNWNTDFHLMFLCLFLAPNIFYSLFNFLKLLYMSDKFYLQENGNKKHWNQRKKKVPMYGSSHGSFALLSVKSRKQRGVLWFLRGSMPSWQLQADWADMCPKGMCSPTSSCGRITRDLRSCYNIFLYSFLLFIYMLKKHWLEELHPWCHMNKWIVVQKMVGKKMMVLLLGNSTILMSGRQWECQWQNHKTSS